MFLYNLGRVAGAVLLAVLVSFILEMGLLLSGYGFVGSILVSFLALLVVYLAVVFTVRAFYWRSLILVAVLLAANGFLPLDAVALGSAPAVLNAVQAPYKLAIRLAAKAGPDSGCIVARPEVRQMAALAYGQTERNLSVSYMDYSLPDAHTVRCGFTFYAGGTYLRIGTWDYSR